MLNPDWLEDCATCKHTAPEHSSDKKTNYRCLMAGCTCSGYTFSM